MLRLTISTDVVSRKLPQFTT